MTTVNFEIRCFRNAWSPHVQCLIFGRTEKLEGRAVAVDIIFSTETAPRNLDEYARNIPMEAAQQLMDDLWTCGVRPTEGSGSAGSLAATERHLHDLQKIVGKKLGVELK